MTLVGWSVFAAYLVTARSLNDRVFPFTTLNMYAHAGTTHPSRLLAVDGQGRSFNVDQLDHWRCDRALPPEVTVCLTPEVQHLNYVERDEAAYVRDHAGSGQEPHAVAVSIVRRIWLLEDRPGPPSFTDCEITLCTAVPER